METKGIEKFLIHRRLWLAASPAHLKGTAEQVSWQQSKNSWHNINYCHEFLFV
jgi:hypothetical protein